MWEVRVQFYWTQRFPARGRLEVRHEYRPIVGGSYVTEGSDGASHVEPYCGGPEVVEQIRKWKALHPPKDADSPVLLERRIQYILTTGNNWSGPIRKFRLLVTADREDDIVVACLPDLKRSSPVRYELARENFRPEKELEILVLQAAN